MAPSPTTGGATAKPAQPSPSQLSAVRASIRDLLDQPNYDDGSAGPVIVRLAWHSAGTYDAASGTGGSNGAGMRYDSKGGEGGERVADAERRIRRGETSSPRETLCRARRPVLSETNRIFSDKPTSFPDGAHAYPNKVAAHRHLSLFVFIAELLGGFNVKPKNLGLKIDIVFDDV
ncbi:hypothetical protein CHU98_g774 [Xylaria longipes]|nr:hypothetical protein CHU98_g774 [Xylaria longipes]